MMMNDDIKKYPIFRIIDGKFVKDWQIESTDDYNHYTHCLHHYILKGSYKRNKEWYISHGINQKLFYITKTMHEHIHPELSNITDDEFYEKYKVDRWECLFNKKYSSY